MREAGGGHGATVALGLRWPDAVLCLARLAVPMPFDDPLQGGAPRPRREAPGVTLGSTAPRREGGVPVVPLGALAQLRRKPFFAVIVNRLDAAVRADLR